jgi:hypothetical protein
MYTLLVTGDVPGASTYFNPLLQQSIIPCTSGTRPASPGDGWTIYETDTKRIVQYSTTLVAWVPLGGTTVWSSYSPAWTATTTDPTIGNGSIVGSYMERGQSVDFRVAITVGSTTSVGSGVYRVSLPFAPKVNSLGVGTFIDASAGAQLFVMTMRITSAATTGDNMRVAVAGSTIPWGATSPVVPATGDVILLGGTYEKN